MKSLGNNCYCYKDECNQKEWEKKGYEGKRKWVVIHALKLRHEKETPMCPYCNEPMTITANFSEDLL